MGLGVVGCFRCVLLTLGGFVGDVCVLLSFDCWLRYFVWV